MNDRDMIHRYETVRNVIQRFGVDFIASDITAMLYFPIPA